MELRIDKMLDINFEGVGITFIEALNSIIETIFIHFLIAMK